MTPENSAGCVPRCPATRAKYCGWVPGSPAPRQRIQIEQVRYGRSLHIGSQLDLTFNKQVVVPHWVVLHVPVSMRRERRAVRIDRIRINGAGAILIGASRDIPVCDTRPLARTEIKRVHVRTEVVIVAAAEQNHRTTGTESRSENRAVPRLRDRRKAHPSLPWRARLSTQEPPQAFF